MIYPKHVTRCHHIKINGIQCGSPAMRGRRMCYFHHHVSKLYTYDLRRNPDENSYAIPLLEDAESIQIALMRVSNMLLRGLIGHKDAGLVLYALQTASANLKRVAFEPDLPTKVVIDEGTVGERPVGATAWSDRDGKDYDDLAAVEKKRRMEEDDDYVPEDHESLASTLLKRLGLPETELGRQK